MCERSHSAIYRMCVCVHVCVVLKLNKFTLKYIQQYQKKRQHDLNEKVQIKRYMLKYIIYDYCN